jgi:putative peptide zinc metalloprotease protein
MQGRPIAAAGVPERPTLASGVRPVGELRDTGFKDRQWLIRRGDEFIQVTELLYRLAEQANGERTLEEIAAALTESTDWMVTADNVRMLIQLKLIPAGLIIPADGSVTTHSHEWVRSPLAVNLRTRVIGPRIIDPIAKVLQVLYTPLVLIPVLVTVAIAHVWLYIVHGVADSVLEVLYTPGLFLVALAIMLVAAIFHEFGHASALRYGGGKARGMGVGLYLIYPAFYTNTTDSYRLGRRARVRTDLGGFYFYLIFALGIMGLYLATGQEFLLLIVLLINLDIIYQCLPFVRFDGYWALADLTGVPDFFSQMGAFLRSVLPLRRWKGAKLPNLKPWVKAVFALYIVVTVPVLALLLFRFITGLPGIAAVIWDSLLLQARGFSYALDEGDLFGMAASGTQAFILMLQTLGILYLLYALGGRLLGGILRRSARIYHGTT